MSGRSPAALLRGADKGSLYVLGLLSALGALGLVVVAGAIADGLVALIAGRDTWTTSVLWGLGGALLRGGAVWAQRVASVRTAAGAKARLRAELGERLLADGRPRVGSMTALAATGLDELDKYYTVFIPALVSAATVPLLVGARILVADPVSAIVIVVTVPLIPVFMVLIGMHTRERVAAAVDALGRLSDHLLELARGLPVLVGLGRVDEATGALRSISERYRTTSMRTLRTAFLSALALELLSTISVAMVAVFVGVRLVAGTMPLELGLVALILAPEVFAPLRDVGAAFHSSENGVEALRRARAVVDAPSPRARLVRRPAAGVRVAALTVAYGGRPDPVVDGLEFAAPALSMTSLDGASGAGKSTVLALLARGDAAVGPDDTVHGVIDAPDPADIAWMPQHPHAIGDTVLDELRCYAGLPDASLRDALRDVGLLAHAGSDPASLSPGELRRLAFARVLVRVEAGARLVLLDEPTAHLDAASAALVRARISSLKGLVTIVLASHDPELRRTAELHVTLGRPAATRDAASAEPAQPAAAGVPERPAEAHVVTLPAHAYRELLAFVRPVVARLLGAASVGTLSTCFAIALTSVSAWLIVRASEHPPILYLLVAMVGVRFFGIGRAVLRYGDRLLTHDAVFASLTRLRLRLWTGLADRGPADRALLGAGSTIDRVVGDADRVRDEAPRVLLPPVVGVLAAAAAVTALWIIYPPAGVSTLALALVALVLAPWLVIRADARSGRAEARARSAIARAFAALLAAADEVSVGPPSLRALARIRGLDADAARHGRRTAQAVGAASGLVVAASVATAILALPLSAPALADGRLTPPLVAVLVMTPLGLIEPLLAAIAAAQLWPGLRDVLGRISTITEPEEQPSDEPDAVAIEVVDRLTLEELSFRYPGAPHPAFSRVTAEAERGDWLVVTGPSGSGKSTLLAVLLRYLRPSGGSYLLDGRPASSVRAESIRGLIAWCPQEGHLFDSTLRANLLLARPHDEPPTDAELVESMRRVGLGELLAGLPAGLDTPIGSDGSFLSGGQRQRVAVARTLLARSDVVLVDEPTAHLDEESAAALIADLRSSLAAKTVVLVSHRPSEVLPGDRLLDLDSARRSRAGREVSRIGG